MTFFKKRKKKKKGEHNRTMYFLFFNILIFSFVGMFHYNYVPFFFPNEDFLLPSPTLKSFISLYCASTYSCSITFLSQT